MGQIIDKLNEARAVVAEIMESGGEFTDENEEWLSRYTEDSEGQADWLGHLYRRAKSESAFIDENIRSLMKQKKKANRTASWARDTMFEVLIVREQLGHGTSVAGAAHLMKQKKLTVPEDPDLWPVEFLKEQPPKLDTVAIKRQFKTKTLPDGFSWVESLTVVMK